MNKKFEKLSSQQMLAVGQFYIFVNIWTFFYITIDYIIVRPVIPPMIKDFYDREQIRSSV